MNLAKHDTNQRGEPQRKVRAPDELWRVFGEVVGAGERSERIREYMRWQIAHPNESLPTFCTYDHCDNERHDHTSYDEETQQVVPLICGDCGKPAHYDRGVEDYRHDDPDAPDCFLISGAP